MPDIITPQTVLTPAGAATELQAEGLDALGLTVPTLSPAWGTATPAASDYDATAMKLSLTGIRAPFRGILTFEAGSPFWSEATGNPVSGPVAVLRLHLEAAQRLERIVDARYGSPGVRPVPIAMVAHGITMPDPVPVPNWYPAGEPLGLGAGVSISFHDNRGLPIDPIAVAAMFRDLLNFLPGIRLLEGPPASETNPGGLDGILALASGVRIHVIDPHGAAYVPTRDEARLKKLDGTNAEVAEVPDGALIDLAAGEFLGRSVADDSGEQERALQWGFATTGTLARTPLNAPALPAGITLARQFLRVMAVDLAWHLLGNRTAGTLGGIPADDDKVPDFALPRVRTAVPTFDYLVDGNDVLGAAAEIAAGFPPGGPDVLALAVSPAINAALQVPPATGGPGHWPAFPPPDTATALPSGTDPRDGVTGAFRAAADGPNADLDVIITIPADAVPAGTHVRVFPREFVEIDSIDSNIPSFVRGDGGSAIAVAGADTRILLVNPYRLQAGDPKPNPARLEIDIVVTSRAGQRRLFSLIEVAVSNTPATIADPAPSFGGEALLNRPGIAALFSTFSTQSIAPVPLFGLQRTVTPPGGAPTDIVEFLKRLASESQPRQGPRLPTQARFETILALGQSAPPAAQLNFQAVLTGGRWDFETRSARPDLGDPGNPPGPDLHAAGIRCDGQLAYDLAFHALKRAQPIIPLAAGSPGWLVMSAGDNWDEPPPDATGTVSAAMLETVAAICDTPELSFDFIPVPQPTDTVQSAIDSLANAINPSNPPAITVTVNNEDQIRRRIQREMVTSKFGQRDALWSLRRALGQAREFIYIESPAFAKTARPGATPAAHEVDLVELIRARMASNPRLKVMVCLPRLPDYAPDKAGWVRTAFAHRNEALKVLTDQDKDRVAAFHPIGFPGRPAGVRTTVVIVDDVWCLTGTSHFRRRGLTFDGAVDVVSIDRAISRGYSSGIARFRQELMAAKLGIDVAASPATATSLWVRLARPEPAFDLVADLLQQGGLGRCSPVWAGPTDTAVLPQTDDIADPDGATGANFLTLFASLLSET